MASKARLKEITTMKVVYLACLSGKTNLKLLNPVRIRDERNNYVKLSIKN